MSMRPPHPQRLTLPAAPGALLKRLAGVHERLKLRVSETGSDPAYLAQIRELPCLRCGMDPCGLAAHVRMNSGVYNKRQAMAKKPSGKWTVPLCDSCHTRDPDSQHKIGERPFWYNLGINPLLVCERLYPRRGDLVAMRAVIIQTIAERGGRAD